MAIQFMCTRVLDIHEIVALGSLRDFFRDRQAAKVDVERLPSVPSSAHYADRVSVRPTRVATGDRVEDAMLSHIEASYGRSRRDWREGLHAREACGSILCSLCVHPDRRDDATAKGVGAGATDSPEEPIISVWDLDGDTIDAAKRSALAIAKSILTSRATAECVVTEALTSGAQKRPSDPSVSFVTWVTSIAKNKARAARRTDPLANALPLMDLVYDDEPPPANHRPLRRLRDPRSEDTMDRETTYAWARDARIRCDLIDVDTGEPTGCTFDTWVWGLATHLAHALAVKLATSERAPIAGDHTVERGCAAIVREVEAGLDETLWSAIDLPVPTVDDVKSMLLSATVNHQAGGGRRHVLRVVESWVDDQREARHLPPIWRRKLPRKGHAVTHLRKILPKVPPTIPVG